VRNVLAGLIARRGHKERRLAEMSSNRLPPIMPRRLLARVRDVMASDNTAEQRLHQLVANIATDMVAEVCSVYVLRPGEVLELYATQGLRPEAVHKTRLRLGEGLVGDIAAHARPLALADAPAHPNFVFRPETGEEIYRSFLGVPILRGGHSVGVLAVQNRTARNYSEEEIESLQTVAMVLAELVTGGELVRREELVPADGIALRPLRVFGVKLNGGTALGIAHLHRPSFRIRQMVTDDSVKERRRLRQGFEAMHGAIDDLFAAHDHSALEQREILEAYRMIARDSGWLARIEEAIDTGLTAEAAVQRVHSDIRARLAKSTDPMMRERLHDIEDLALRLLGHLDGPTHEPPPPPDQDYILFARTLGAAQLLDFDRTRPVGLVLEEGTPSSHVTIIARAFDIPVVGQAHDIMSRIEPGDPVLVDGDNGVVSIRPDEDVQQSFRDAQDARNRVLAHLGEQRMLEPVTADGVRIEVHINVGMLSDLGALEHAGAEGVGLFRTEIPFMLRSAFPDFATQRDLYSSVLDQAGGRAVIFRTLDVGGDKLLSYWPTGADINPAMGWRAIRIGLDRPAVLRVQLRALIHAASGRDLHVMFPMISEVAEIEQARTLLDLELDRLPAGIRPPAAVKVGIMVEVPSIALQICRAMPRIDFVAVGGNDLFQFLFASDRANPRLVDRYDFLSPTVLNLLGDIAHACDRATVPVSFCGEVAANPLDALALIGVGFRKLSVSANAVPGIKAMIRSTHLAATGAYIATIQHKTNRSLRSQLMAFALDHGIAL
jgi:phosphotransferase system enzyme I (PtsP)